MFDKDKFKKLIETALGDKSITAYSTKSDVNRTYISKLINKKLDRPPSPEILRKLATASEGKISYKELMSAAGYLDGIDCFSLPPETNLNKIPIVKSFKNDIFNEANIQNYKIINQQQLDQRKQFFIRINKNHLGHNIIKPGALALIKMNTELKNGDTAAVIFKGEELIRKIYFTDHNAILLSDTINYQAKIIDQEELKIVGKCITILLKL